MSIMIRDLKEGSFSQIKLNWFTMHFKLTKITATQKEIFHKHLYCHHHRSYACFPMAGLLSGFSIEGHLEPVVLYFNSADMCLYSYIMSIQRC